MLVTGIASLVFNELTVQVRRIWPWRRDDADPVHDAALNEYYRYSVYAGSIVQIEVGALLAGITLPPLAVRIPVYLCFGVWLTWRRRERRKASRPSRAPGGDHGR